MAGNSSLGEAVLDLVADGDQLITDIEKQAPGVLGALDKLGMMGGAILAAGFATAAAALVGITGMIWNAGNTIDAAYDRIAIETGATDAALEGLQQDFDAVFSNVPASADDAATAIGLLNTRLGWTGTVLQDTTGKLLEMNRLTGGDLIANGEAFSRMVGDWGLNFEDVSMNLDTVFVASQRTGIGTSRLMELMVQFGAPMRLFNFSFMESAALLSKWEKEGVNTELVMGSLRIAAGQFARENVPLREGLEATISSIQNATSESEALAIAMDVFGARAGPDMAAAILEGRFALGDLVTELMNADGAIMAVSEQTMDWGERWTLFQNRMTSALGPAGLGLMDAAVVALGALEAVFARPDIQNGLMAIVNGIVALATAAANSLPGLIDQFFAFVSWLQQNEGVVVAVLAIITASLVAFAITGIGAAATSLGAFLAAAWPVIAIIAAIGAVAYILYEAWTNNWWGIQDVVMQFWAWLQPMLTQLWSWLSTNIPAAVATLAAIWQTVLLPAIMAVWAWMTGVLFPFFVALGNFLRAVFGLAVTALAGIWQNVLFPALQQVWSLVSSQLMPIFKALADFWNGVLGPLVRTVAGWIGGQLAGAFSSLTSTLQSVTSWLQQIADMLNSLTLPDWMTPGSPTPWEIGLWGVLDAMKDINRFGLPEMNAALQAMPAPALASSSNGSAGSASGGGGGTVVNLNIGTLIADDGGLAELERKLRPIREVEGLRRE